MYFNILINITSADIILDASCSLIAQVSHSFIKGGSAKSFWKCTSCKEGSFDFNIMWCKCCSLTESRRSMWKIQYYRSSRCITAFDHARPIVRVDFLFPRQAFLLLPPDLFLYNVVYYGTVYDYPLILWLCSVFS